MKKKINNGWLKCNSVRSVSLGLHSSFWKFLCWWRLDRYQCFLENILNPFTLEKGVVLDGFLCCKFCCRQRAIKMHSFFFAYLNGADSYTSLQLIVFTFYWYKRFEKFILDKSYIDIAININVIKKSHKLSRSVMCWLNQLARQDHSTIKKKREIYRRTIWKRKKMMAGMKLQEDQSVSPKSVQSLILLTMP